MSIRFMHHSKLGIKKVRQMRIACYFVECQVEIGELSLERAHILHNDFVSSLLLRVNLKQQRQDAE